jgi:hypothetical protein
VRVAGGVVSSARAEVLIETCRERWFELVVLCMLNQSGGVLTSVAAILPVGVYEGGFHAAGEGRGQRQ